MATKRRKTAPRYYRDRCRAHRSVRYVQLEQNGQMRIALVADVMASTVLVRFVPVAGIRLTGGGRRSISFDLLIDYAGLTPH
jgi:hypothetical protein